MRTISPALLQHLRGSVLTLAMCWRLQRRDGLVLGFTTFDQALHVGGVDYEASTGIAPTSLALSTGQSVANANLVGVLNSDLLTEDDLERGRWAGAEVQVFLVNWQAPADGTIPLLRGEIGQVKLVKDASFDVEVRALGSKLQQQLGDLDSRTCPAKRCTCLSVVAARPENTRTGSVTRALVGNRVFLDDARTEAAGYFKYGALTWTSGQNAGLTVEVFDYQPGVISLVDAMPRSVAVGDTYSLTLGVDGEFETCKRLGNAKAFQGFPRILGPTSLLSTQSTKTS